ncbi:pullulanase-associated domain-containing protein, partial [Streptomyces atrovirens]
VDSAGRTASDTGTTTAGQPAVPEKPTAKRHHAVVHHRRADGDYDGLLLRTADGTTARFAGRDAYGAFAWITPGAGTGEIRFTIEKDGVADGPERVFDLATTGEVWTEENSATVRKARPTSAYPPQDQEKAVLHYHRPDGDYDGWGLHTWTGSADPPEWNDPVPPVREDSFGLVFEVPLSEGAASLSYILHKKEEKDVPDDEALDFSLYGHEVWRVAGDPAYLTPSPGGAFALDLSTTEATWIGDDTVVWAGDGSGVASQQLVYATEGDLTIDDGALSDEGQWLRLVPAELTEAQRSRFPQYTEYSAFRVDPRDRDRVGQALEARLIATQRADSGALLGATGVRIEGNRPEGTSK